MANVNSPFGLKPVKDPSGDLRFNKYYVPASYGTALYVGDPVIKTGTSNDATTVTGVNSYEAGTLPEINKSAAGDTNLLTGVIVGFEPNPDNLNRPANYNPASTEAVAIVADDPNTLFEIQDDASATLDKDVIGLNANLVFTTAGDNNTGLSGANLDATTPATTQTFQLKILRLVARADNELGDNAKYQVKINQHTEATNTAGI